MSPFALRKLHSASGVLPVGVFLLLHLWTQSAVHDGRAAYDGAMDRALSIPLQPLLELVFVLIPLAFHASYGVVIALRSRPTVTAYPTARNWMHVAQRSSGAVTLIFILWHMAQTWLPRVVGEVRAVQMHPHLVEALSSTTAGLPLTALGMLVGVGAASFHFANGLWSAAVSWGLLLTRRAQSVAGGVAVVLGVVLFLAWADVTVHLATGGRVLPFGGSARVVATPEEVCRDPVPAAAPSGSGAAAPR